MSSEKNDKYLIYSIPVIICINIVLIYLSRLITLDDALIYYRYFRNAIDGLGLVYNQGENLNALSSPLFTYLGLALSYITGNILITMHILSGFFLLAGAIVLLLLMKDQGFEGGVMTIPSLLTISAGFFYLTFGLETTLFVLLFVSTLYFYFLKRDSLLLLSSTLLFLTRGESVFLIIIIAVYYFIEHKRLPDLKYFILPVVIICFFYGLNYILYGSFLPETFGAKMSQGKSGMFGKLPFLKVGNLLYNSNWVLFPYLVKLFLILMGMIGAAGIIFNIRNSRLIQITLAYLAVLTGFYLILNIPNYPWYYSPYYISAFIYFAYGLNTIRLLLSKRMKPFVSEIVSYGTGLVFVLLFLNRSLILLNGDTKEIDYKNIGIWINENLEPKAKIACIEIGHIGWYSDRHIIDILGLVSPKSAEYLGNGDNASWYEYYSPDYIVVHDPIWSYEEGVLKYISTGELVEFTDFRYPGYKILKPADSRISEQQNP